MSWENKILELFPVSLDQMILVADPDGVLKEEKLLKGIGEKGFILLEFEDSVSFRYLFETNYRFSKDRDRLIVRIENDDFNQFPYEYLKEGYRVNLKLDRFFPNLNYSIIKQMDSENLKQIYQGYQNYGGDFLGEWGTATFILRDVYEIFPELIKEKTELFRELFKIHFEEINIPEILVRFLVKNLKIKVDELDLPLEKAFTDRKFFFDVVQKQWETYIEDLQKQTRNAFIPFEKQEIRVFVDSLFLEGLLEPVEFEKKAEDLPSWVQLGIKTDEDSIKIKRFSQLLNKLEENLSEEEKTYKSWFHTAQLLAETQLLFFKNRGFFPEEQVDKYKNIHQEVEGEFSGWLLGNFGSLVNLPYTKSPVMVHHIPNHIRYIKEKAGIEKVALIVIDGLSAVYWSAIKELLSQKFPGLKLEEKMSYAWVPTITSISRQAIFAGQIPIYFKDFLSTTHQEEKLWKMFWQNNGLKYQEIKYVKGLGKGENDEVIASIDDSRTRVIGLVVNIIDKLTHSEQFGVEGLLRDISLWMEQEHLADLLKSLFERGYEVFITSDHGSVVAEGQGKPNQGILVESKGERTRIYSDTAFIDQVKEAYSSVEWPGVGLPDNMFVLLASHGKAFVQEGRKVLSHGGISIEEVIVPFIRLWEEK